MRHCYGRIWIKRKFLQDKVKCYQSEERDWRNMWMKQQKGLRWGDSETWSLSDLSPAGVSQHPTTSQQFWILLDHESIWDLGMVWGWGLYLSLRFFSPLVQNISGDHVLTDTIAWDDLAQEGNLSRILQSMQLSDWLKVMKKTNNG